MAGEARGEGTAQTRLQFQLPTTAKHVTIVPSRCRQRRCCCCCYRNAISPSPPSPSLHSSRRDWAGRVTALVNVAVSVDTRDKICRPWQDDVLLMGGNSLMENTWLLIVASL